MVQRMEISRKRVLVYHILISMLFFALIFRLGWLQIVEGEHYQSIANKQQTSDLIVPSKRGTIYDRNGKELAVTTVKSRVWGNPYLIENAAETARQLAPLLGMEEEELRIRMERDNTTLVSLARRVDDSTVSAVKELSIRGIWFVQDNERAYPYGDFAAYVLGHTTDDGRGIAGIEQRYETELAGIAGRSIVHIDGARRQLPLHVERHYPPEDGVDLVLSLDEVIQHYSEKAVSHALYEHQAKRVMAIMMEVKTGEILSMAVKPDYDPNQPRTPLEESERDRISAISLDERMDYWFELWRNPALQEVYEPGSVFKIVTAAAALEEGVAAPGTVFHSTGTIDVAGTTIRSWRWYNPFGEQTFQEAVINSDNPVFVQLVQKMGKESFYHYLRAMGLTRQTGIDYPGETNSFTYSINQAGPVEMATMSFGQGISITPIQMMVSATAVINDGYVMKPRLVREFRASNGDLVHRFDPEIVRQAISTETSRQMRQIMEIAVEDGSGRLAAVQGHRIGGKTGTAQKVVDGVYKDGAYISSFYGFFPADDPEIALLIIVDEPGDGYYFGGEVAAPVAGDIFREVIRYLEYEPVIQETKNDEPQRMEVIVPEIRELDLAEGKRRLSEQHLKAQLETHSSLGMEAVIVDQFPKPGTTVPAYTNVILYTGYDSETEALVMVPDLGGKTIREVSTILDARELRLKITGSGLAREQVPEPGTLLEPGSLVNVHFGP